MKPTNSNRLAAGLFVASLLTFTFVGIAERAQAGPPPTEILTGGFIFDCKPHPTIGNGLLCTIVPVKYEGNPKLEPDIGESSNAQPIPQAPQKSVYQKARL